MCFVFSSCSINSLYVCMCSVCAVDSTLECCVYVCSVCFRCVYVCVYIVRVFVCVVLSVERCVFVESLYVVWVCQSLCFALLFTRAFILGCAILQCLDVSVVR